MIGAEEVQEKLPFGSVVKKIEDHFVVTYTLSQSYIFPQDLLEDAKEEGVLEEFLKAMGEYSLRKLKQRVASDSLKYRSETSKGKFRRTLESMIAEEIDGSSFGCC